MIRIENVTVSNIARAVYSARNAYNSWAKSDSDLEKDILGAADLKLAKTLCKAGSDHRKFLRFITVTCDITAPLYWWKEFDTYKVGTVSNSCSTMHKIADKEFVLDDFSHEHLIDDYFSGKDDWKSEWLGDLCLTIARLNRARERFLETKNERYWWQMIQLLPSSYNQRRTLLLNYEVLHNQYHARKNHKLDCWRQYCEWIESLPYAKQLIVGEDEDK